jgi:predicted dehydrogenase
MADRIVRVGIAGLGRSGYDIHARWLREVPRQYRIVAVADEMAERRREAVRALGCRSHKTPLELVADEGLDLFVNALPSHMHPSVTIAALAAGLHVVCEKPLAVRVKDVDRMIAAAKKARRVLAPFQNSRFYPGFRKIQQIIASGKLGRIIHIRMNWSGFRRRWDWQTRREYWGGNLNNTGPHALDQAVVLFGDRMPQVFCRMESERGQWGDADDFSAVTLYGRGSPVIELLVSSYQAYPQGDQFSISGTLGGLAGNFEELKWRHFNPKKAPKHALMKGWSFKRQFCRETLPWVEKTWKLPPGKLDVFQRNSMYFYNNLYDVLMRKGKLVVTPEQVRRQVAVIEECHRQNERPRQKSRSRRR